MGRLESFKTVSLFLISHFSFPCSWFHKYPGSTYSFECTVLYCTALDTHNRPLHDLKIPLGDVLIHAGDFSNVGLPQDVERFRDFLASQPHPAKVSLSGAHSGLVWSSFHPLPCPALLQVVIAGNHDLTFDTDTYQSLWQRFGHPQEFDCHAVRSLITMATGVTYLEDSGTVINGISIWGSPW